MADTLREVVEVHTPGTDREQFVWAVVGPLGGVHVWAQRLSSTALEVAPRLWDYPFYGGIEVHRRTRGEYDGPTPTQAECWLLGGPCWHDGSSLYFSDHMSPVLYGLGLESSGATSYALSEARSWYRSHLEGERD
jgi:hypothetical protein